MRTAIPGTISLVPLLLIDIDEVCFPFAHAYNDWLITNGIGALNWEGVKKYNLDAALGRDDHDVLAESFLNDPATLHVPAIEDASKGIASLRSHGFTVYLCSARFALAEGEATRRWVARNLPGLEGNVFLTRENHSGSRIVKGHLAWATGAVALIDDAEEHHRTLPEGCSGLLMPRIGELPSDSVPPGSSALAVSGWGEVVDRLTS